MRYSLRYLMLAGIAAAVCAVPALAHHSYAMFDRTKTVSITGTVKGFQWTNPHSYTWIYVPDNKGGQALWAVEGASPNELARRGWTKRTLNPGDKVTVTLNPLKDGRTGGFFVSVVLPDGKTLSMGGPAPATAP